MQDDEYFEQRTANTVSPDSESNEIQRFELLRNELIELEKRVQKSADQSEYEEVFFDVQWVSFYVIPPLRTCILTASVCLLVVLLLYSLLYLYCS